MSILSTALVLGSSAALACNTSRSVDADIEAYRAARGELVRAETSAWQPRGRYVMERVRLESTTIAATGWVVHPRAAGCFPAVLLQDGREENSGVVGRLPAEFGDVVVLALDYPTELPYTVQLSDFVLRGAMLRDGARRIPSSFLLGARYLARRGDVDPTRVAIAATSFAVPFAVIAAAADTSFRNVALIYGAGDLPGVLAANLTSVPRWLRQPVSEMAMEPFGAFAPERFIARIAPRPIVMVNGIDDPQMPVDAVRRLYDAARAPKSMIWLRTGHLMPTDSALIRTLIDSAFARMSVLRAATASPCAPRPRGDAR